MWNLAPLLPTDPAGEPAFTRVYKGRGEPIDRIFASHRLVHHTRLPQAHTVHTAEPLPSIGDAMAPKEAAEPDEAVVPRDQEQTANSGAYTARMNNGFV